MNDDFITYSRFVQYCLDALGLIATLMDMEGTVMSWQLTLASATSAAKMFQMEVMSNYSCHDSTLSWSLTAPSRYN